MDTLITTVIITSGNSKNGEYVSPLGVRYEHGKHNYHHHHHYLCSLLVPTPNANGRLCSNNRDRARDPEQIDSSTKTKLELFSFLF